MDIRAVPAAGPARPAPAAVVSGLRLGLRYWPVLLALWLGTLLAALPLAFIPAGRLLELAERPVIAEIADGVNAWQVLDAFGLLFAGQAAGLVGRETSAAITPDLPGLGAGLAGLAWAVLLVPLSGGVVSAFLYGGTLSTYQEAPAPFRLGRFLSRCWRWFGAFLLLGLLEAGLFLAGLLAAALLALGMGSRLGSGGMLLAGAFAGLLLAAWLILFETARVQTVASGRPRPFHGLGQALRLVARSPGKLAGFYLLALPGLLAVHAVYRLLILPLVPLDLFLPALLAQQSFIILRLLARAVRLAGLTRLVSHPVVERPDDE